MVGLEKAISAIWASSAPVCEKRRLGALAVTRALGAQLPEPVAACWMEQQQELLAEAQQQLGVKVDVTSLKAKLRASGRPDLASRVSRLSKVRNAQAHPDRAIIGDVIAALRSPDGEPEQEHDLSTPMETGFKAGQEEPEEEVNLSTLEKPGQSKSSEDEVQEQPGEQDVAKVQNIQPLVASLPAKRPQPRPEKAYTVIKSELKGKIESDLVEDPLATQTAALAMALRRRPSRAADVPFDRRCLLCSGMSSHVGASFCNKCRGDEFTSYQPT